MGQKPNWTKEEKDYLEDAWGRVSISGIAKKLNRSVEAVKIKAQKIGLSRHLHADDKPTLEQVWEALGIKGSTGYNTKRFLALGLPVHKHKVVKCSFRTVDIDEFWMWAEQHQRLLNFRNFEENALGVEPGWVKQKRIEDIRNFLKPHNCQWTPEEDDLLKKLLAMYKFTYADLSKRFNRSEGAIKRHIHDLKLMERPLRVESRLWTDDEVFKLLELWDKGYSYERIADQLGRTALQVRGKHERIRNPEMSKRAYRNHRDKNKRPEMLTELVRLLKIRRNAIAFDEYFQKDMCQNWDDAKGCVSGETNCDTCKSFQRIKPQYCRRCGTTILSRQKIDICERCKKIRKWQHKRKQSVLERKYAEL